MILLSSLLVVGVGVGVLVAIGLVMHSKDQWRTMASRTQEVTRHPSAESAGDAQVDVQRVSFGELWAEESRPGSAYWQAPETFEPKVLATSAVRR